MPHLTDIEKKCVIFGASICAIFGLVILVTTAVAMPSANASNGCFDIDCLRERLRLICENDPEPKYLDCQNILKCMDADEQKIMRELLLSYHCNESS